MKKAIIALIVSSVLFTLVPQQVKAYDHEVHKQSEAFMNSENSRNGPTIEVKILDNGIFVNKEVGKPRLAVATFIWFVVKAIASGIVYEASVIVWNYVSPHLAAQNWANQNGYGQVSLINNRVVYDSGCWKPEFPNNPFCK